MPDMAGRVEEYKSWIKIPCKGGFSLLYTNRAKNIAG